MKKRVLSLLLVMCMLLAVSGPIATAADIQPYYLGIGSLRAEISDPENGWISCNGSVFVRSGYRVEMTMELMQKQGNSWESIKTWETSGSGSGTVELTKSYYVVSGYEYKVVANFDVYRTSGTFAESGSIESYTVYY